MDPKTPLVLAAARYSSKEDAIKDFHILWGARRNGEYEHLSVAVLSKDSTGQLTVARHNSTTKKAAWSGAVLGAALVLVVPPAGVVAVASGGASAAAVGGLIGHFMNAIDKEKIDRVAEFLRSGETGLLIVAVDRNGSDIEHLLANAQSSVVTETEAGDLDEAFEQALAKADRSIA